MPTGLKLTVGLKTDPIEYRYSHEWLFRLLADEGIRHIQLGTFFELYQLPDDSLHALRRRAEDFGLTVSSVFTSHRELGGFFRGDPAWEAIAHRNFERLIEVGGILGARSVGSNPGSVLRDRMGLKAKGTAAYVRHMKELLHHAKACGVETLGIEPMSCLAEPPTLPDEIRAMIQELLRYHRDHAADTAAVGFCADVSHGYADRSGKVLHGHMELLEIALPYTHEIHLKNTDATFCSTFGFSEAERKQGIVDVAAVRDLLVANADVLPTDEIVGYLEISGPKTGRDCSDARLEEALRASLGHLKTVFASGGDRAKEADPVAKSAPVAEVAASPEPLGEHIIIAPSMMCADMTHIAEGVRRLEESGCDWLHFDVMDAHFVPNMPLGLELIKDTRKLTAMPFDVHLMVEDNDFFIEQLAPFGVDYISAHVESSVHFDRTLQLIRSTGAKAGAALNPATPLQALDYVLEHLDYILVMTVNPGYAGQTLVPSAFQKIADTRDYLQRRGIDIPIQVDGNVSFENIPGMVAAGAQALVAGTSSVYSKESALRDNVIRVRECCERGLAMRKTQSGPGKDGVA